MKVQIGVLVLTLAFVQEALPAFGVSEKSVKNWDDQKLCEDKQKWFFEGDDKAFDIVSNEINQRASVDAEQCEQIGRAWVLKAYKLPSYVVNLSTTAHIGIEGKVGSDLYKGGHYRRYAGAIATVYERYGEEIYIESFRAACENRNPDQTAVALAMLYVSKRGGKLARFYPTSVDPRGQLEGFGLAMRVAANLNPNFCSEDGKPIVEQRIREMVEVVYNTRPSFSWPKLDRGMSKRAALNDLPKPSHEEPMGDLLALHFCPPTESQDLLSLYFFNDALLASQVSEIEADCSTKVVSGDLARPAVIEAMME